MCVCVCVRACVYVCVSDDDVPLDASAYTTHAPVRAAGAGKGGGARGVGAAGTGAVVGKGGGDALQLLGQLFSASSKFSK